MEMMNQLCCLAMIVVLFISYILKIQLVRYLILFDEKSIQLDWIKRQQIQLNGYFGM